jgi:hypothetical protein
LPAVNADGQPGVHFKQSVQHRRQIKVFSNGKSQEVTRLQSLPEKRRIIEKKQKGLRTFLRRSQPVEQEKHEKGFETFLSF